MPDLTRTELIKILASTHAARRHLINLAGVDLSGLDLSRLDLSHCNFTQAILRGCKLVETQFYAAVLNDADFTGANMDQAIIESTADDEVVWATATKFCRCNLRRASMIAIRAEAADFSDCDLTGARIDGSTFPWAKFCRAKLVNVSATGARFWKNDWRSVTAKGGDWSEVCRWGGPTPRGIRLPFSVPGHDPKFRPAPATSN